MRKPSARPCLYTSEAAEGHVTRRIAIKFVSRGGRPPLGRLGIAIKVAQTAETTLRIDIGRWQVGPMKHLPRREWSRSATALHPRKHI
jgi:hypothetical protein